MAAKEMSKARGVLDGHEMAKMFAWMRPNDLIWNYWVNNYLLGNQPPAFDILYWNADTTRLPARLHGDFLDLIFTNPFVKGRQAVDHRRADRHEEGQARDLCHRRHHRSHHAVEGRLPDRAASTATRRPSSCPIRAICRACSTRPVTRRLGTSRGPRMRRMQMPGPPRRQSTRAVGGWIGQRF